MRDNKLILIAVLALLTAALLWYFTRESNKHTNMMREKQNFFPIETTTVPAPK